jgi:hypothetical protein
LSRQYPNLDFEQDLLGAFGGRVSWVTWMEPPARINSQSNLIGIQLKDPAEFRNTLETLIGPLRSRLEPKSYAGVDYYRSPPAIRRSRGQDNEGGARPEIREPTPCFGIVGDYLLATDSEKFFQQAILAKKDRGQGLAGELDFKLIAGKIARQPGGEQPGLISFTRPEEGLRNLYEIAGSQQTRDWLGNRSESNQALKAINQALQDNPLPPFAVVQKYLAPGGAVLVNDESGFHHTAFTLKRE